MRERHPLETELAQLGESTEWGEVENHVRGCSRCRRVVADYGWLQGQIGAVLEARATAVPLPQPSWQSVSERVERAERRSDDGRLLVAAGVVLAAGLMLGAPSILGRRAEAQTIPPTQELVTAPAPVKAADLLTRTGPGVSGTVTLARARCGEDAETSVPSVPHPTPPGSDG